MPTPDQHRKRRRDARERAAATHDLAAEAHDRAAELFDEHGMGGLAAEERRLASLSRQRANSRRLCPCAE